MHIVIIGGGAGGLELASKLGKKRSNKKLRDQVQVTLIDQNDTHLWKPLLHEVATGALDDGVDAVSYRAQAHNCGFDFQLGKVINIDRDTQQVELAPLINSDNEVVLKTRYVPYDYVVFALGSITNDFNVEGISENCIFLDKPSQAMRFHKELLESLLTLDETLKTEPDASLTISIVGAGATGVELSAELFHAVEVLKVYGLSRLTDVHLKVNLIEAGPRILPALPERISANANFELSALGVSVLTNTRVVKGQADGFVKDDGELIASNMMVWAAGVKAPDFMSNIGGLETNRVNQLLVKPTLQTLTDEHIFAIGDCASLPLEPNEIIPTNSRQRMVPPTAQAAHQMASLAFKNLTQIMNTNQPSSDSLKSFKYKDYGSLVSLSHYSTVGSLMGGLSKGSMMIEGRLARIMYVSLYRMHQLALFGFFKMVLIAISGRINKVIRPRLKLH
ncbi:NAD(P)/FAD-dependent oxidoreductase [Colwellia echini]|uniref:NAD(P)/FAD-dependent oxidoreductase n=1 Tax=Colwellia echini TaxID=1982103 RepID=A0ABY3MV25_9GAMM|nr:NAD(P)/FAD-dependent oxidoreductase [Colwellia echini]TYK65063.1 NAD(P)/FAD-dependent oxidoreductase [Colwellia echini]